MKLDEERANTLHAEYIKRNYFSNNPSFYMFYPDYEFYQRLVKCSYNTKERINKLFTSEEGTIVNEFSRRMLNSKLTMPMHHGAFYKCRKLGIATTYDKEYFDLFSWSVLSTLFFCLFSVKILTTSLIQGGYVQPKGEIRIYFLSMFSMLSSSLVYIFIQKNRLDKSLDLKYSPIYTSLNKIGRNNSLLI